jgi:phosphate transport system ATP-binding protein
MDEPASALDPVATSKIEDLIDDLAEGYTVIIVTHNMQQAARIPDRIAVFLTGGELVEYDDTDAIFGNPGTDRVEDYITGKFGELPGLAEPTSRTLVGHLPKRHIGVSTNRP